MNIKAVSVKSDEYVTMEKYSRSGVYGGQLRSTYGE